MRVPQQVPLWDTLDPAVLGSEQAQRDAIEAREGPLSLTSDQMDQPFYLGSR